MMSEQRTCPVCGGVDPSLTLAEGERYCTPLSCSAWTFTHRLTKQGPKPIRADGRADLKAVDE
jgi:hypothetical protein